MTQSSELMINPFSTGIEVNYASLVRELFELDRKDKEKLETNDLVPHFLAIQSLIRCSIEYCESAYLLTIQGKTLPSLALLRSVFDHFILASFLDKAPNGPEATKLILEKNRAELGLAAEKAGIDVSVEQLMLSVDSNPSKYKSISTRTSKLIRYFEESDKLDAFYFLLGQNVHPKAAFFQYVEVDSETGMNVVRRTSLHQDQESVHGFTFQLLRSVMLLDSRLRNDERYIKELEKVGVDLGFAPNLTLHDAQ